jgi:hypothetical protein
MAGECGMGHEPEACLSQIMSFGGKQKTYKPWRIDKWESGWRTRRKFLIQVY